VATFAKEGSGATEQGRQDKHSFAKRPALPVLKRSYNAAAEPACNMVYKRPL